MSAEHVVLVDEQDNVLGTMPKAEVHSANTPLHRGFSTFIFRAGDKRLLLQQRSGQKKTWPLMWSNSCCGHPSLGEAVTDAARRRLKYELGLAVGKLEVVSPYRYCFSKNGIVENEICPIMVGVVDHEPQINPEEVEAYRWTDWNSFIEEIDFDAAQFSAWCVEEARILRDTLHWQTKILEG